MLILLSFNDATIQTQSLDAYFRAEKPSFPCSSASFSYPIGASSLYGPTLLVSLTGRLGKVMVSDAEGAILDEVV